MMVTLCGQNLQPPPPNQIDLLCLVMRMPYKMYQLRYESSGSKFKINPIFHIFGKFLKSFAIPYSYFKSNLNIFCEFIPSMIFLLFIFGYLVFMIIAKWILFDASNSSVAPTLIITLIDMVMLQPMSSDPLYGEPQGVCNFSSSLICHDNSNNKC